MVKVSFGASFYLVYCRLIEVVLPLASIVAKQLPHADRLRPHPGFSSLSLAVAQERAKQPAVDVLGELSLDSHRKTGRSADTELPRECWCSQTGRSIKTERNQENIGDKEVHQHRELPIAGLTA